MAAPPLREILERVLIHAVDPSVPVGLSLSAGTDSSCLLFSLVRLGIQPALYTYHLEGRSSDDLARARMLSAYYSLPLRTAAVPVEATKIANDVMCLLRLGVRGKVCIQCCHGHLRLAPLVKETRIFNGSGIDGIYGAYRDCRLTGAYKDRSRFTAYRRKHLADPNDDAMQDQQRIYSPVTVLYPYRAPAFVGAVMGLSWEELNQPRLKYALVRHYPEFGQFKGLWRSRGSQQIVAGTREAHNVLLRTSWNRKNRRRVQELYKDMAHDAQAATA